MAHLENRVAEIVKRHELTGVLVSRPDGSDLLKGGDLERIRASGLFQALFGGALERQTLAASLQGGMLPQIWSQDDIDCFVSVTDKGCIVGAFITRCPDPVALYRLSKAIMADLLEALSGETGE